VIDKLPTIIKLNNKTQKKHLGFGSKYGGNFYRKIALLRHKIVDFYKLPVFS
jgi:hypothetical protein